jgi:hypothetical protein
VAKQIGLDKIVQDVQHREGGANPGSGKRFGRETA